MSKHIPIRPLNMKKRYNINLSDVSAVFDIRKVNPNDLMKIIKKKKFLSVIRVSRLLPRKNNLCKTWKIEIVGLSSIGKGLYCLLWANVYNSKFSVDQFKKINL